jgi:ribosomal protein S18 acetylase RimI-like enzyme
MESARLATPADIPIVAEIAGRIREEKRPTRGGAMLLAREAGPWPLDERLAALIDRDDGVAVVGTYDGIVFGYGLATVEELVDGRRLGRLDDLAVDADARGSGIGEAMMNLVLTELQAAGCIGVDSRALPGDRETKNFFESFGLKARLLIVHRAFDDERPA